MKSITLRLSGDMYSMIERMAVHKNLTKSELVREAIGSYVSQDKKIPPGSFLAQASDLIGGVEGPRSLSSRAKQMKGYGE